MSNWKAQAHAAIIEMANTGERFTVEDVTNRIGRPDHPNDVGSVFREASANGLIRSVGNRPSTRQDRHGSRILVWIGTGLESLRTSLYVAPTPPQGTSERWVCTVCRTPATFVPDRGTLDSRYGVSRCPGCNHKQRLFRLETR